MKNLLFKFEELGANPDAATRKVAGLFNRAGATVVQSAVTPGTQKSSGVSYREMTLTHADGQKTTLRIKETGDVYQVLVNGNVFPVTNQDDHAKAIKEIADKLESGRTAFQKKLAAVKVKLPPSVRTAAPKMREVLTQKRDALVTAITAVRDEIAKLATAPA